MIQNLAVKDYKGIKRATLLNLGHINVIAGKNNSGKSSILEAIAKKDPKHVAIGHTLTLIEIEKIQETLRSMHKGYGNPSPYALGNWIRDSLHSFLDELVFSDESQKIIEEAKRIFLTSVGNFQMREFGLEGVLDTFLQHSNPSASYLGNSNIVPAKRLLGRGNTKNLEHSHTFTASGGNLANYLFFLKNQPINSDDYGSFLKVSDAFKNVSSGLDFNLVPKSNGDIVPYFSDHNDRWFSSDECGLGPQDLLIIISSMILLNPKLMMIEEPENHIHPEIQRNLLALIHKNKTSQFILTTHSSIFLDPSYIDRTYFIERETNNIKISDQTSRATLLKGLGYSIADNIACDLICLTEGPSAVIILEEILRKLGHDNNYSIRFWPLGGDIMGRLDLGMLIDNFPPQKIIALIDKDPNSRKARKQFLSKCEELDIECKQLERYAIENYIPINAISSCKNLPNIPQEFTEIDPQQSVEKQLGFSIKGNLPDLISATRLEDIENTDLLDFCIRLRSKASLSQGGPR